MVGNRLLFVSYLKVFAMLLVVFGHCICIFGIWNPANMILNSCISFEMLQSVYCPFWHHLSNLIARIHMPLFVFISGFLYSYMLIINDKYKDAKVFYKKKFFRLILPYLFWKSISLYSPVLEVASEHLWFIESLVLFFFIMHPINKYWKRTSRIVDMLILTILVIFDFIITNEFHLIKTIHYFPFFIAGIILVKSHDTVCAFVKNYKTNSLFLLYLSLLVVYLPSLKIITNIYVEFFSVFATFVLLSLIVAYTEFCNTIKRYSVINKCMLKIEDNSMGIYLLHHFFIVVSLQSSFLFEAMYEYKYLMPFIIFLGCLYFHTYLHFI